MGRTTAHITAAAPSAEAAVWSNVDVASMTAAEWVRRWACNLLTAGGNNYIWTAFS
jgi:hypothetical protein